MLTSEIWEMTLRVEFAEAVDSSDAAELVREALGESADFEDARVIGVKPLAGAAAEILTQPRR